MIAYKAFKTYKNKREEKKAEQAEQAEKHSNPAHYNGQHTTYPAKKSEFGQGQEGQGSVNGYDRK